MKNYAQELFLLITTLSQLRNKDMIVKLFIESLNDIFKEYTFTWLSEKSAKYNTIVEVCTKNKNFGFVSFFTNTPIDVTIYSLICNASQFIALLLEKLEQDKLLLEKEKHLQMLVDEQTIKLNMINQQLEKELAEREYIETEISMREQKYRTLFEESFDCNFITSPSGKILDMNNKGIQIFGYDTKNEILCLDLEKDVYVNPPDRKRILSMVNDQGFAEYEVEVKKKNGETMYTYCSLKAIKDKNGEITSYRGILRDITQHRNSENALKESEEKYRIMFANNPQPMWIYDLETLGFLEVNDAAMHHYGYTKDEFLSMTLKDIRPKEDIDALLKDVEMTKNVYNAAGEWRHLKKNGEMIYVIIISHTVTFNNRKARHVIVNDITERKKAETALKESEEKFSVAFMTSPYAITITQPSDGKFIEVNDAFVNISGYTKEEVLNNTSIKVGMWVNNDERVRVVQEIMKNEKVVGREIEFKRKNGEIITGLFSAQLIHIKNIPYILSSINDITERKRAEIELIESERTFSDMFHKSPVTIAITVPYEGIIIDVNETFLKDMEYSREEVIGHTLMELGIFYNLKDREKLLDIIKEKGFVFGYECQFKSKSGKVLTGLTSIVPINIKGKVYQLTTVINITDRKQAEKAIVERDNLFRKLSSQVPGMIYQFLRSPDGFYCVPYTSDGIRNIFGCTPQEVRSDFTPIANVILPEDINNVISTIEFSANHLSFWQCEYRVQLSGEPIKWLLGQSMPEKLSDGSIIWYGFNTDITESKKVAEALKENEAKLNTLIDTIPDLVWLKDVNGVYLSCNKRFEDFFGDSKQNIIGKTDYNFVNKELADFFREKDKIALNAGISSVNEEKIIFANDGHSEILETIKTPVYGYNDQIIGVLGIGRDITERKQNEEILKESSRKLQEAQEMAHLGFWSWDIKTGKVEWSDEVYKIFDLNKETYTPQIDSILALSPWPEDHQRDKELIVRATESHQPGSYEQKFLRPDQSIGYYYSTFQGLYDEKNELVSIIGTVLDITERKKIQEEILKINETLEQRVKIRTEQLETAYSEMEAFSYSVSHDLQSPLRAIDGFSKILLENSQVLDEETLRLINIIRQNSINMSKLIEDLITFAKVGKAKISICPINIKEIVKSILNELKKDIIKNNISVNIMTLPDVKGDTILFNQIWSNLIRNAIKYSSKTDNPEIEIGGYIETNENEAVYYIKDNGVGFNMTYVNKLFRVFERLHTTEEFEGTGIGLAIVKKAVNRHGGRVWAQGEEGKGACFYFSISLFIDES